jgi:hypothetical protein
MESGSVECVWRCINYVAFLRDDFTNILHRVADLPGHDEPELSALRMEMAAILRISRRQVLFIPIDDVRNSTVIVDETAPFVLRLFLQFV